MPYHCCICVDVEDVVMFKSIRVLLASLLALMCALPASADLQVQLRNASGPMSASNPLSVSTSGRATYVATSAFFTPAATPTDVAAIFGSASKTVRVLRVSIASTQTAAGINNWFLIKRSTATTGGTPTTLTSVPLDSANAAATAVVVNYTANPTPGSAVGTVKAVGVLSPAPASVVSDPYIIHDELYNGQGIVLRGTGEGLALNFNGAAVPAGLSMSVNIFYSEE